ncbi:hypothetical protein ABH922_002773 [Rhodococcus sp. 27YEA15]|uniref:hypothetical protein n=1 Tax=Rhodococcus sp. 27YEA15 TaxID=3156259 RepID=UPI003C7AAA06
MTAPNPVAELIAAALLVNSTLDADVSDRLWGAFPNTMTLTELAAVLAEVVQQHTMALTARAEAAEATIARVERELEQRYMDGTVEAQFIRAALEGEQQ